MTDLNLKYFDLSEFDCKYSGRNEMSPNFLRRLDDLRDRCGFPFIITSGYRDPSHPVERKKTSPGKHSEGIAADIKVSNGSERYILVANAIRLGFNGIGVHDNFIHVDTRDGIAVMWGY